MPGEPDLSHDALDALRASDDCLLDVDLLTTEARQVGHHKISQFILRWAEIGDGAADKLLDDGDFGGQFPKDVTAGECNSLLMNATKVLFGVFAFGLAERLKGELNGMDDTQATTGQQRPGSENFAAYVEKMAAAAIRRAVRELELDAEGNSQGGHQPR